MSDSQTHRDQIRHDLTQTIIGRPLIDKLAAAQDPGTLYDIIIDPNVDFRGGREGARARIVELANDPGARSDPAHPYVFATLTSRAIREMIVRDGVSSEGAEILPAAGMQRVSSPERAIYRIWEDTEVAALLTNSLSTVKADAAQAAFSAEGRHIVWAVVDSGIDGAHTHFQRYENLALCAPLEHRDFTAAGNSPLTDEFGHGTHVAGIIGGSMDRCAGPLALIRTRNEESGATENNPAARPHDPRDGAAMPAGQPESAERRR
jgi:serine protease AprX